MDKKDKILVLGGTGLVGSNLITLLQKQGYINLLFPTHQDIDLLNNDLVDQYFTEHKPDYVFDCAAKVGGINANNSYQAEFIYINTAIQTNIIYHCYKHKIKKMLFLGSSCIYPAQAEIPIKETSLLSGLLEETNKGYAVAKINGIVMCQMFRKQYGCDFISAMPTNLYGKNDRYDLDTSHVFPAFIRKIHLAKKFNHPSLTLWGDGSPMREFLFVEDLVDALIFLMNNYSSYEIINVGTGSEISIKELAETMCLIIGYKGNIQWDTTKPNGTFRKVMDISRINQLGWVAKTKLEQGIKKTYKYFLQEHPNG